MESDWLLQYTDTPWNQFDRSILPVDFDIYLQLFIEKFKSVIRRLENLLKHHLHYLKETGKYLKTACMTTEAIINNIFEKYYNWLYMYQ